jgi:hypothetical protein
MKYVTSKQNHAELQFFTKIQICNIHVVKPKLQARVARKFPIRSYAHSTPNDCAERPFLNGCI